MRFGATITPGAFRAMLPLTLRQAPDTPDRLLYPAAVNFLSAPETYVIYTVEACSAVANAIRDRYGKDGAGERLHVHIEPGLMHCYASTPAFKESRQDFGKQIEMLKPL